MTLLGLGRWLRTAAKEAQAPEGQPNTAAENLNEAAALIEAYLDLEVASIRKARLVTAVKDHNANLVATCAERRAHPDTPCGGRTGIRCADCPRTMALTSGNRTIPG